MKTALCSTLFIIITLYIITRSSCDFHRMKVLHDNVYLLHFSKEGLNDVKDAVPRQELQALSSSVKNLLAQWFAVGLLDLKRITWDSPASILEKVS